MAQSPRRILIVVDRIDQLPEFALLKAFRVLLDAMRRIATTDDTNANYHLEHTGSYAAFDEPGSVAVARETLRTLGLPLSDSEGSTHV